MRRVSGPAGEAVEISLTVKDEPKVDIFLTDTRGYQNYKEGRGFRECEELPTTPVKRLEFKNFPAVRITLL
jgi:hypothetical protein